MRIPNYYPSDNDSSYQDDLNQELRNNLSDEGWQAPSQSTATINELAVDANNAVFWYDEDEHKLKIKANGVVRTFAFEP